MRQFALGELSILTRAFRSAGIVLLICLGGVSCAQPIDAGTEEVVLAPPRTWDELADEVQARTDRQVYPMTGMRSEDVAIILSRINSLDYDEWGESWSGMARDWIENGDELAANDAESAADAYIMAWRYASFGGWPVPSSSGKQASFDLGVEAFAHYAALQSPAIETVLIPFEGEQIRAYLQLPDTTQPAPVIISIGGLDSYKEYVAERYGPVYLANDIGWVAVDSPNTGETRVAADEHGERFYSAVIDYLLTRDDVDATRIGLQGVSLGGYWATKTAFAEPERLRFVVNWAGALDEAWSPQQLRGALASREYLFDAAVALMTVYDYDSPEALVEGQQRMSVVRQGLIGKPTPPMLIVNGMKDTLVPSADSLLLLRSGTPKAAWLNPEGFHLGRSAEWNDERIIREVIMPWVVQAMGIE